MKNVYSQILLCTQSCCYCLMHDCLCTVKRCVTTSKVMGAWSPSKSSVCSFSLCFYISFVPKSSQINVQTPWNREDGYCCTSLALPDLTPQRCGVRSGPSTHKLLYRRKTPSGLFAFLETNHNRLGR